MFFHSPRTRSYLQHLSHLSHLSHPSHLSSLSLSITLIFSACDVSIPSNDAGSPQIADAGADELDAGIVEPTPTYPDCAAPLGNIVLDDGIVEEADGYDAELAAIDVEIVPSEIITSSLSELETAIVAYALELPQNRVFPSLLRADIEAAGALGHAVLAAFAKAAHENTGILDFVFLRRGFHRFYACTHPQPVTLDEFKTFVWDYTQINAEITVEIVNSGVKGTNRRLVRHPSEGIYIAETIETNEQGEESVRETEIIVENARTDGALDFYAFSHDGLQMDGSHFATRAGGVVTTAAPYTCLFCHVQRTNDPASPILFNVVHPD